MSKATETKEEILQGPGFHVLEGLIDVDRANQVREFVLAHLDEGQELNPGDVNLTDLLERDEMFEALVTHPELLAVVHEMLGEDAKLAALTAKTLMPGCGQGRLHVDYPYWAMDPGMPVEPALMLQVIWMMQPFGPDNGGTWVLPGSQVRDGQVDIDEFKHAAVQIKGGAGDAFLSHGLLWHQTAVNHSTEPRVAILINFSQLAIRPLREMGPFSERFLGRASDEMKQLLPLDINAEFFTRLRKNY